MQAPFASHPISTQVNTQPSLQYSRPTLYPEQHQQQQIGFFPTRPREPATFLGGYDYANPPSAYRDEQTSTQAMAYRQLTPEYPTQPEVPSIHPPPIASRQNHIPTPYSTMTAVPQVQQDQGYGAVGSYSAGPSGRFMGGPGAMPDANYSYGASPPGATTGASHVSQGDGVVRQSFLKEDLEFFQTGMSATADFCRSTTAFLPQSISLKQKLHIPLGFILSPLAPSLTPVLDVHFGANGKVVRCHRCRTYINPFCMWESGGRRWSCNICGFGNDCPQHYFSPLDETGRRSDRNERPELSMGSVEFIAPGDYMVRPPQPPAYLFVIDVSAPAVASGMLATVCQGIKTAIASGIIPGGSRTQFGFITFDSTIHFYVFDSESSQPHMVVVPNLSDVFVPLPDGCMVNLEECQLVIETLLDTLPTMWANQKITESCGGSALKATYVAMKNIGGKVSLFLSTIPTLGELTLSGHREAGRTTGAERETELLKPANDEFKQFATLLVNCQISVDLYVCPIGTQQQTNSMDLPTLSQLSQFSAGELHFYPNFNAFGCGDKLQHELYHSLTRTSGWEAVMRIRVSRGWKITNWFGHFLFRHNDLLVVPNCHEDQTFSVTVDIEENVAPDPYFYLQSALLYTNSNGERRIRVHTVGLPVTQNANQITASVDEAAIAAVLCSHAIELARKNNLAEARQYLQASCGQILSNLSQNSTNAILPCYVLGLLKSIAFREGRDVSCDLRCYHWIRIGSLSLSSLTSYFYPKMISLNELSNEYGTPDSNQEIILPPSLGLSASQMSQAGVYLIQDGECMMIWIGKGVDTAWLQAVFGVDSIDHINPEHADALIGATGHQLGLRVAAIIDSLRRAQPPYMKLFIVKQGSSLEYKFFCSLIEDRSHACMMSLSEFLQKIGSRMGSFGSAAYTNGMPAVAPAPGGVAHQQPMYSQAQPRQIPTMRQQVLTGTQRPTEPHGQMHSSGNQPLTQPPPIMQHMQMQQMQRPPSRW